MKPKTKPAAETPLRTTLKRLRGAFLIVGVFSLFMNMLMLVAPIYMLQVYDRVLTSQSLETLAALTVLAVVLIGCNGLLELTRAHLLNRIGARFAGELERPVFDAQFAAAISAGSKASAQPLRDLETIRGFLTGNGLPAFFDSPWTIIFLGLIFLFHPILGAIAAGGAVLLFLVALSTEFFIRAPGQAALKHQIQAQAFAENALRNAEAAHAMGMLPALSARWRQDQTRAAEEQSRSGDRSGTITAIAKFIRPSLQIALLGAGAFLAINGEITPGVMIAASIIMGRALAPIEASISQWRAFVQTRAAHDRLSTLLTENAPPPERMALPRPAGAVSFENVFAAPPAGGPPIVKGVSFSLEPGEMLGVIGPSGSGKSTLARLMVGVWRPSAGHTRLDGAEVQNFDPAALGPHIGYLPQDVELFEGTAAQNISRFTEPDAEKVVAAAKLAGAHEMILQFAEGYDTPIGRSGQNLSGGQRQRLALARALYGDPALVVLDEPNASLDTDGERALAASFQGLKDKGCTVIVISHRPNALVVADKVLVLRDGRVDKFGPRDDVLPRLVRPVRMTPGKKTASEGAAP